MKRFELTENHIKLVRLMAPSILWWEAGGDWEIDGAPAVNRLIPYGSRMISEDLEKILGPEVPEEQRYRLHIETGVALQVILVTGEFTPGTYETEDGHYDWKKAEHGA